MRAKLVAISLGLGAACLATAAPASAQSTLTSGNWRQASRPPRDESVLGPQRWAFELRFAPYYPQIDDEFGGATPYETAFDSDPQFYIGVELDWQAVRIPYVGALGPGFGWGYTSTSTVAKISGCTVTTDESCESGSDTSLTIMPMHLSAVLRLDELMRRTRIPIVPYAKLGIAFATWSAGTSTGTATYDDPTDGEITGSDTTWGVHLALGGMVSLNGIDPQSTANLYESAGIHHIYLFGEWMDARLNGLGSRPQMHVGTSTWVAGLAADM